jgi:hypothetical protein
MRKKVVQIRIVIQVPLDTDIHPVIEAVMSELHEQLPIIESVEGEPQVAVTIKEGRNG